jgi:hypothetical protein
MTSNILTAIKRFFNQDTRMENENGNNTENASGDSADTTKTTDYSATSATLHAVYNPNGTISYYNPNGTAYSVSTSGTGYSSSITYTGGIAGGSATYNIGAGSSYNGNYTAYKPSSVSIDYSAGSITAKNLILDGANITDLLSAICDRLAIIENADPDQLKKYNALNEAYQKYKFLEKLLVDKDDKK